MKNMLTPTLLLLSMIVLIQVSSSAATSHIVGDDAGWMSPITDDALYSKWAAHQTFQVGDILVFQFRMGHSVTEVSKTQFENCDGTNPISTASQGPVSITLKSPGEHFFICTTPGHCKYGQKLAVHVGGAGEVTSPTSPHSTTPPSAHHDIEPTSAPSPTSATSTPLPPTGTSPSDESSNAPTPPLPPKFAGVGFVLPLLHMLVVLSL